MIHNTQVMGKNLFIIEHPPLPGFMGNHIIVSILTFCELNLPSQPRIIRTSFFPTHRSTKNLY